ncbi:MAG: biotin transporter BioY [Actinomycetota bacterium]|nr:biotin transporter BioY [Actinomycetota bacterium]
MKIETRSMIMTALFAALTAVGALIRVPLPFTPVPLTLQVFFVLLAGAILGAKFGALSQIIYVLLGAVGLPVFSGGSSGFGVIFGPTGGYLFGFVLAAAVVGLLMEGGEGPNIALTFLFFLIGILVIYALGTAWLALITKMGLKKAIIGGALPFIPLDLIKAAAASLISVKVRSVLNLNRKT